MCLIGADQNIACVDVALFVVLRSKYGENKDILRKNKTSFLQFSKYYLFLKTQGYIANQSEAFIN